jgi:hypothetical protein
LLYLPQVNKRFGPSAVDQETMPFRLTGGLVYVQVIIAMVVMFAVDRKGIYICTVPICPWMVLNMGTPVNGFVSLFIEPTQKPTLL